MLEALAQRQASPDRAAPAEQTTQCQASPDRFKSRVFPELELTTDAIFQAAE